MRLAYPDVPKAALERALADAAKNWGIRRIDELQGVPEAVEEFDLARGTVETKAVGK
jgi:hypothetical protein